MPLCHRWVHLASRLVLLAQQLHCLKPLMTFLSQQLTQPLLALWTLPAGDCQVSSSLVPLNPATRVCIAFSDRVSPFDSGGHSQEQWLVSLWSILDQNRVVLPCLAPRFPLKALCHLGEALHIHAKWLHPDSLFSFLAHAPSPSLLSVNAPNILPTCTSRAFHYLLSL